MMKPTDLNPPDQLHALVLKFAWKPLVRVSWHCFDNVDSFLEAHQVAAVSLLRIFWHNAKLSIALVERTKENKIEVTGARIHRCNPHTGNNEPNSCFSDLPIPFSTIVH